MEKFQANADYKEVVEAAKLMGIQYAGKKKPVLIEAINAKIDAGFTVDASVAEQPEEVVEAVAQEADAPTGETQKQDQPAVEQPKTTTKTAEPRQPRAKKAKWFEEEGAELPYTAGDIIEITSGDILVGRKAQMTKYSAKQNAIKCILIHPVKGTLQNCEITMDFSKIQKAEDQSAPLAEGQTPAPVAEQPVDQPAAEVEEKVVSEQEPSVEETEEKASDEEVTA